MSNASIKQALGMALALSVFIVSEAAAQLRADTWIFVGTAAQCGVAGNKIVTSQWSNGLGLPDNGVAHPDGTNHQGLLLSKNGPTSNCSAAGADIVGLTPGAPIDGLGFDFRIGSHCGAGATRFNVYASADFDVYYFFGCAHGTHSPAPQDPTQWERVSFSDADGIFCVDADPEDTDVCGVFSFGTTPVYAIELVFDEGTETTSPSGPTGVGLATIDNILIDTTFIRKKGNNPITP